MEINRQAPAVTESEIEIAADRAIVWDLISGIDQWPSWNPAVREASLNGPLAPGTKFRWKAGPGAITSTLRQVEPPRLLAWTGKTFGINAIHVYRLESQDETTLVSTAESWEGLPVRLLRGRMQQMLEDAVVPGLQALKVAAERTAQNPPSSATP
jgi:uncharacterized protein YndB with AHSA1/START domain